MFPDTELLPRPDLKVVSEETFFIGNEEFPRLVLLGDEWVELEECMISSGSCPDCKKLGYCKYGIIIQSI